MHSYFEYDIMIESIENDGLSLDFMAFLAD